MKSKNGDTSEVKERVNVPKIKRSQQTRQKILDAAALWLNRKGLAIMSLQDLANEVGLQTASLYYYFPSKDALIEEVMHIGIEVVYRDVKDAVERLGPGVSFRDRIRVAVKAHLSSLLAHGEYTSANIRNYPLASDSLREKNLSIRRQYAEYWRTMFEAAQHAGEVAPNVDLTLIRLLLIGAMNWSTEWFNPRKKSIDAISDVICSMLFSGIAPQENATASAKGRRTA
jgi:AcrR family transcriptional regulator